MLEVKQVSKLYENDRGVHNIDFSMQRGEIVGFLGPNGAGKTTTMRMITGYLNPTHGQIWVDGHSMADNPKKARRKIGYLPETPPLYPEMTVQAYLRFIANLRDVPAREQKLRVGEAIDKLGLQGREKQIIRSLSKGYKQRLGLAQAILHQPDLLILDEPTSGLDPKQIIEIRQLIHELGENHTVLLSTHILPEINAICNRVLIINQGRVVLDERPEHLGRTMGETFEVSLEVKGPRERILTELRSLEAVAAVKEVDAPSDAAAIAAPAAQDVFNSDNAVVEAAISEPVSAETVKLLVTSADRSDIREALFFRLAGAGYPILEMKRESLSLEDIFLKLTTDEPVEADSTPKEEVDADA
ncbi:ABC transporter ATP-binding protein [Paenibacillus andongensis]|uniref:ABC transporter ATP-binding protein n=1 Tax=Paenibacillus andongensis TaxID=2975482 RepID=UPI0021BA8DBF|nr:ABC transporter ATP-binding protein [Paenibacillus andongensis]